MSDLMDRLLSVSSAPTIAKPQAGESHRKAEFSLSSGEIEVNTPAAEAPVEGDALSFLEAVGQDPDLWEVTGFRRTEWGTEGDMRTSTRFTFARRSDTSIGLHEDAVEEIIEWINDRDHEQPADFYSDRDVAILAIGDLQLFKLENMAEDGTELAAQNAIEMIDAFAYDLEESVAGTALVAWLGDHGEGFVSQGGANTWRTVGTLQEQNRIMRRIMYYAVDRLAPLANRLVMVAVPGNHGESQRISGKGTTRYDDNHDVEQLNIVAEGVARSGEFEHVEFYVPQLDEISLCVDVGGIRVGAVHGDRWNSGKHSEWWLGQSFHDNAVAGADVLLAGHWHHLLVQDIGRKLYVQVPALEAKSQWWKHRTGIQGHPGAVILDGVDGQITNIRPLRATGGDE